MVVLGLADRLGEVSWTSVMFHFLVWIYLDIDYGLIVLSHHFLGYFPRKSEVFYSKLRLERGSRWTTEVSFCSSFIESMVFLKLTTDDYIFGFAELLADDPEGDALSVSWI